MQFEQAALTCESRARLRYKSEIPLELTTVSSILDCESGCTTWKTSCEHHVQRRVVLWQEESRNQKEERACQSLRPAGQYDKQTRECAEAIVSQQKVASRLVKSRIVRHASWWMNRYRGRTGGYVTYRASKGKTYGEEVVERMDQVSEEVRGRTQRNFEERRRAGVCKAERWDDNFIANGEVVHADRSIQR